jgi:hypothetical protein
MFGPAFSENDVCDVFPDSGHSWMNCRTAGVGPPAAPRGELGAGIFGCYGTPAA